jgi:iron complex outermembrane receptor protein
LIFSVAAAMFLTLPPAAAAEVGNSTIETITVTARHRAELLQDIPISISAITGDALVSRGLQTVTDIGDFTPNVKFNSSVPISASNATAAIYIRGIGQNDYQLSADPGVALYVDGVYISRGVGNVLDLLNVDRIEVLRGPQGTLFGRNTIGGAVSVVTRKPSDTFGGSLDLTTGSFNRAQVKAIVDVPVNDKIFTNASIFYHRRDGYVKGVVPGAKDLGGTDQLAGRFAVRAEPNDRLTVNLALDATREREESAPNVMLAVNENAPAAQVWNALYSGAPGICANPTDVARLTDQRCFNSQWVVGPYRHGGTFTSIMPDFTNYEGKPYRSGSDLNVFGVSAQIDWRISDSVTAQSITAYRRVTGFWTRDSDHSPADIVETRDDWVQDQLSQEFQVIGTSFSKKLNWVAGAYYSSESGNHKDLVNVVDAVFLSGAVLDGRSLAAFAHATYTIVDGLDLTAGIRWTEDRKTFGNVNQYIIDAGFLTGAPLNPDGSGVVSGEPLMGPLGMTRTITNRKTTPMASLSYRWSPQLLTYFTYSQGFKGGGFTQRVLPTGYIPTFEPETSKAYEVGFKSDLLERRIRLNGALFTTNYNNLQITVNDPGLGFAPIIHNAAKSRIRGFELELEAKPIEPLRIEGGVGFLEARYTNVNIDAFNTGVTTKTHMMNAPKWTLSASISYDIAINADGRITPRVDWSYRSKVYNDAVNTPLLVQPGYSLVNAAITHTNERYKYDVSLGVKNITKKLYLVSGYVDNLGGITEGVYGRPREWYLTASKKF